MKWNIRDFITEDFEQRMQNSFAKVTGYGIVFVDTEGNHIGEGSNFTKFCREINSREEGKKACAACNKEGFERAVKTGKPCIYICHAGLINIIIPFKYEDCLIGALTAGQVICKEDCFYRCREDLRDKWLKDPLLKEYYGEIEEFESEKIIAMVESLGNVQNFIFENRIRHDVEFELYEKKRELLVFEKEKAELEMQLKATQFELLQKKVIPHFMFNVLNSVSRLISLNENEKALVMLNAYAKMMRYKCSGTGLMVELKEELEYIRNYISIQNIRFDGKIKYSVQCEKELENLRIPFFSLQPFVENSIEHGILDKPDGGNLTLDCRRKDRGSLITITDDGVGMTEKQLEFIKNSLLADCEKPRKGHEGIFNCCGRYKVVFGSHAKIEIQSRKNVGTKVSIFIEDKNNLT